MKIDNLTTSMETVPYDVFLHLGERPPMILTFFDDPKKNKEERIRDTIIKICGRMDGFKRRSLSADQRAELSIRGMNRVSIRECAVYLKRKDKYNNGLGFPMCREEKAILRVMLARLGIKASRPK